MSWKSEVKQLTKSDSITADILNDRIKNGKMAGQAIDQGQKRAIQSFGQVLGK